ncbi:MAG: DUF1549 domain-containing protein [Gemmataceae bacterium]
MIWAKNLLFVAVIGGGLFTLGLNLIPPAKPSVLTEYHTSAPSNLPVEAVNQAFRKQWKDEGVTPVEPAPDLIVARRLALGLMGTVPSLEEIRQFEALPANQRIDWWLDHLFADQRFADYFGERLARAYVGTEDGPFILYRRRRFVSWLSEQVAANRPYDALVRELIAGDGLWTDHPGTNFISVTSRPEMKNQPDPVRLAGRVTRAFLGMRLDCAQCHNHPFAAWKQADFEGLSAFFGRTDIGFGGVHDGKTGEYAVETKAKDGTRVVAPAVPYSPELLPDHGTRRQQLAAWVTHPQNPFFARAVVNRVWALMHGRPLFEPVDNLDPSADVPPALDILANDFVAHGHDLRRLIRTIAKSQVFQLDSASDRQVGETEEKAWAVFPLTRLRPEQVSGSVLQAASVATVNAESHILLRLMRYGQQNEFVKRYGDTGEDEFEGRGGTIPQRLLLMNGELVRERIKENPLNASSRIAWLAKDDPRAVEAAYLALLSRRPTAAEREHFEKLLSDPSVKRTQRLEDLYWALVNSTEFSWNH